MLTVVIAFLFFSIVLYLIFGGADFGVGILELLSNKKNRPLTKKTAYRVIGPVWEANHMWLIICIVIMWIAFPIYYNLIVTQLHIPLSLLLIGIIGRGTAFVFRHYDAYKDGSQKLYDSIFQLSSIFTPFVIGLIAGALISGEMIHPDLIKNETFYTLYIHTWLNPFSILVGFFIVSLTAFTSAIFIAGETKEREQLYYWKKLIKANIAVIITGTLVFLEGMLSQREFVSLLFGNRLTMIVFILVTLLLWPLWISLRKGTKILPRLIVSAQLMFIILIWSALSFPYLIAFQEGKLSLLEQLPPDSVFDVLGWSLIIAGIFVLPGLYHLFKTFGLIQK